MNDEFKLGYEKGCIETIELIQKILGVRGKKKTIVPTRQGVREHLKKVNKEFKSRNLVWRDRYFQLKDGKESSGIE